MQALLALRCEHDDWTPEQLAHAVAVNINTARAWLADASARAEQQLRAYRRESESIRSRLRLIDQVQEKHEQQLRRLQAKGLLS